MYVHHLFNSRAYPRSWHFRCWLRQPPYNDV